MPDRMEIDPEVLRQLAIQHDRVARDTREWAQPPTAWLDSFLPTYGKIAYPVYNALMRYYDARKRAGEHLADQHDQTAASLRAAADTYEHTDEDFAARFRQADAEFDTSSQTPNTVGADRPVPIGTPADVTAQVAGAPGAADAGVNGAPAGAGHAAVAAGPAPATEAAVPVAPAATATGTPSAPADTAPSGTTGAGSPPPGQSASGGVVPPTVVAPAVGVPAGADQPANGTPAGPARGADGLPMIPIAPFASALARAKDQAAGPDFVIADRPDDDLVLARTLLGGILSAVRTSALGLQWSVAVMRGPGGAMVLLTSNEGRGWLPAGLFVPRGTALPWGVDGAEPAWEGISDPARILAEFSLMAGARSGARLTALVSSAEIDTALRERFGDVSMQSSVPPSDEIDLSAHTPDTVDRLTLTGMPQLVDKVDVVPDAELRARCLGLAIDAHARMSHSGAPTPEVAAVRSARTKILDQLREGAEVPREWWDELRDADDLLTAAMLSRRTDVRRVQLGELRIDDRAEILRTLVFERRCDEVLMLLSENVTRQDLRDAVYAHVQIIGHPLYTAAPAVVAPETAASADQVLVSEADLVVDDGVPGRSAVSAGPPAETEATASATEAGPPVTGTGPPAGAAPPVGAVPPSGGPPRPGPGAVAPDIRRDDSGAGRTTAR